MRLLFLTPILILSAASPALQPGRWTIASAPTGATLDGRKLDDLPYAAPSSPDTVCLTAIDAADPAAWLARDVAKGCTFEGRHLTGGRVDLTGTCAPQAPGLARGTLQISGRWSATSYDLTFATTNPSETGVMGFTGTMTGRRTGACR